MFFFTDEFFAIALLWLTLVGFVIYFAGRIAMMLREQMLAEREYRVHLVRRRAREAAQE
ncbi:MAG: hypothetical protein HY076_06240 [Candidatus Eisenbacteria bacterium]|uniref:CcmD family protein n=1 Tax=Eiseniibacteriota bacterium TaxID=2212470 RepID=A0A9D6L8J7_UNCEI|nr:hypothetical protein [Candidatus Eisenbacteria bacterium]MBI3539854.1 hypothetical protein [Candidatus Eisenbacteria bacterium]